jgi:purine-nucleoside phosphorylase
VAAGARPATVASIDLFYDSREGAADGWAERGAVAVEMEAATILQVAAQRGVAAACVLGVSNGARRMDADELAELGVRVGEAGYAAVRNP